MLLKSAICFFVFTMLGCTTRLNPTAIDPNSAVSSANTLVLNPQNTRITFIGTALANSHEGTFTWYAGRIDWPTDDPKDARIFAEIEMNSVFTKIELLTKHLKSAEFFDVTEYPTAAFVSTQIQPKADSSGDCIITGNFTIRGITKSLSFPAHFHVEPKRVSFDATITIRQSDFDMPSDRSTTDEVPVTVSATIARP